MVIRKWWRVLLRVGVGVVVEKHETCDRFAFVRLPVVDASWRVAIGEVDLKELDVTIE